MAKAPEIKDPPNPDQEAALKAQADADEAALLKMEDDEAQAALKAAEDAREAAMRFKAPPAEPPTLLDVKLIRALALGNGTRPKGLVVAQALSDINHAGAIDLETIKWANDVLSTREQATLLLNPQHLESAPAKIDAE